MTHSKSRCSWCIVIVTLSPLSLNKHTMAQYPHPYVMGDQKTDFHRSFAQQDSLTPPYGYETPAAFQPQIGPSPVFIGHPSPNGFTRTQADSPSQLFAIEEPVQYVHTSPEDAVVSIPMTEYKNLTRPSAISQREAWLRLKMASRDIFNFFLLAITPEPNPGIKCATEPAPCINSGTGCLRIVYHLRESAAPSPVQVKQVFLHLVNNTVMIGGSVGFQSHKEVLADIVTTYFGSNSFINILQAPQENPPIDQLVELDIVIAEINWSNVAEIGNNDLFNSVNIAVNNKDNSLSWTQSSVSANNTGYTHNQNIEFSAQSRLNALLQTDCAKILGRPYVTTLSGMEAMVQLGGTFATPLIAENYADYKYDKYGTMLFIKPVRKGNVITGRITVFQNDRPEASGVGNGSATVFDYEGSQSSSHVRIPIGQTLVMSGLTQTRNRHFDSKTPFLHRVPFANLLFRHRKDQVEHTELVVLVTPQNPTIGFENECFPPPPFSDQFQQWFVTEDSNPNDTMATDFLFPSDHHGFRQMCANTGCPHCTQHTYLPKGFWPGQLEGQGRPGEHGSQDEIKTEMYRIPTPTSQQWNFRMGSADSLDSSSPRDNYDQSFDVDPWSYQTQKLTLDDTTILRNEQLGLDQSDGTVLRLNANRE